MTEILFDNVEDVVEKINRLIRDYKLTLKRHEKMGNINMANSVKGSIIGLVALLAEITDKSAEDYFREIFPEDYDGDV